jgi:hypothetical protein
VGEPEDLGSHQRRLTGEQYLHIVRRVNLRVSLESRATFALSAAAEN